MPSSPVDFMRRAGVPKARTGEPAWRSIGKACGTNYERDLRVAMGKANERAATGDLHAALHWLYPQMMPNLHTALATHVFSSHMTRAWMDLTDDWPALKGTMLDVGSGVGIVSCWHADRNPDLKVVGVDIVAEGNRAGEQLAEQLKLDNVRFVDADILDHDQELGTFDHIVALTSLYPHVPPFDPYNSACCEMVEGLGVGDGMPSGSSCRNW